MQNKNIITTSSPGQKNDNDDEGKGIVSKLKRMRHKEFIIAGIAVLVMLILYFSTCSSSFLGGANTSPEEHVPNDTECRLRRIERQLTEAVVRVNGVSNAIVIINWESTMELVIAHITQENQNSSSQTPILTQGGGHSRPIIIQEIYPKVIGVLIVADGVQDARVRVDIINAVVTLLNVRPAQVAILSM